MYTNKVTATTETLMNQAGSTAATYLRQALEEIDTALGKGAAAKNPQLVATFMQVCAIDFATAMLTQTLQEGLKQLGDAVEKIAGED